jgi:hypothetical protein
MRSSTMLPRLAATVTPGAPAPGGVTSVPNIHNATGASAARGSGGGAGANPTGRHLLPPAPARTVPDFLVAVRAGNGATFKIAAG